MIISKNRDDYHQKITNLSKLKTELEIEEIEYEENYSLITKETEAIKESITSECGEKQSMLGENMKRIQEIDTEVEEYERRIKELKNEKDKLRKKVEICQNYVDEVKISQ